MRTLFVLLLLAIGYFQAAQAQLFGRKHTPPEEDPDFFIASFRIERGQARTLLADDAVFA